MKVSGIRNPTDASRFVGSVIILVALAFAAVGLNKVGSLGWFTTVLTVSVITYVRSYMCRTERLAPLQRFLDGFELTYEGLRSWIPRFDREIFERLIWSIGFGTLIATMELAVLNLSPLATAPIDSTLKSILTLAIVLIPANAIVAVLLVNQKSNTRAWSQKIMQGLIIGFHAGQFMQLTGKPRALLGAFVRGVLSVMVRAVALYLLPGFVDNWPALIALMCFATFVSYRWEAVRGWIVDPSDDPPRSHLSA